MDEHPQQNIYFSKNNLPFCLLGRRFVKVKTKEIFSLRKISISQIGEFTSQIPKIDKILYASGNTNHHRLLFGNQLSSIGVVSLEFPIKNRQKYNGRGYSSSFLAFCGVVLAIEHIREADRHSSERKMFCFNKNGGRHRLLANKLCKKPVNYTGKLQDIILILLKITLLVLEKWFVL